MANKGFPFPMKGQNRGMLAAGQPELTSYDLDNVRPYDVLDNRARGGQRPGLTKWGDGDQIGGATQPVVALLSVTYIELVE